MRCSTFLRYVWNVECVKYCNDTLCYNSSGLSVLHKAIHLTMYTYFIRNAVILLITLSLLSQTDGKQQKFWKPRGARVRRDDEITAGNNFCQNVNNNPCVYRGVCTPVKDTYKCDCHPNLFKGTNCTEKIIHCSSNTCLNGGTCEESQGTFFCNCKPRYQGLKCEKEAENKPRVTKPFIWYKVETFEVTNLTFIISLKTMGSGLRYTLSTDDGFEISLIPDNFKKVINTRKVAKEHNIIAAELPLGPSFVVVFKHSFSREGVYNMKINIFNHEYLTLKTELPIVVHGMLDMCVPHINLQGCGNSIASSTTYFRAMKITLEARITPGCGDSTFKYAWKLYRRTDLLPFPSGDSLVRETSSSPDNFMEFFPFHLDLDQYTLRSFVAEYEKVDSKKSYFNTALCFFNVIGRPPEAVISGGSSRTVGWDRTFFMDGSDSVDPDSDPNDKNKSKFEWRFEWRCWIADSEATSESFCKGKNTAFSLRGSVMAVMNKQLTVNKTYIFGLRVIVRTLTSSMATQEIVVVEGIPPNLEMSCLKNCDSETNPSKSVIYQVACTSCGAQEKIAYVWDMKPGPSNKKKDIDWDKETERGKNSDILLVLAGSLVPGDVYTFMVTGKVSADVPATSSITLTMSSSLKRGTCQMDPMEGSSMLSSFTVNCSGFENPAGVENATLMYHFSQVLPLDNGDTISTLLHYDTHPMAQNMSLMPGRPSDDFLTVMSVTVSNYLGMTEYFNISVKVTPVDVSDENFDDVKDFVDLLISNSSGSINEIVSTGEISGAVQYITSLTEVFASVSGSEVEEKAKEMRNKIRAELLKVLNKIPKRTPSALKQVSSALLKVSTLWKGEKPIKDPISGKTQMNITSEMAQQAGILIWQISRKLLSESSYENTRFSPEDAKTVAWNLMSAGENIILANHSNNLYGVADEWKEYYDESIASGTPAKAKNEEYPSYKELDAAFQSNVENFKVASSQFFEGIQEISHFIADDLNPEERGIELNVESTFIYAKKLRISDLNGQRFGPSNVRSGIKISKGLAGQLQIGSSDVFGLEVAVMKSNPVWWLSGAFSPQSIDTEVVHASIVNLDTREDLEGSDLNGESVDIYLSMNEQRNESSEEIQIDLGIKDLTTHQVLVPSGGAWILRLAPPSAPRDKYLVVILLDQRPSREDFTGKHAVVLPQDSSAGDKNDSYSILIRKSVSKADPESPHYFYFSVMPHPDNSPSNGKFSYKFYVHIMTCDLYMSELYKWSSDWCTVGPESTRDTIHCTCSHMSLFGGSYLVAPNRIDPISDVKLFLTVADNPVTVSLVCVILVIYILLFVWARRKDLKDKRKSAVVFLEDNIPGDKYPYLVTVFTGRGKDCGTTANARLRLQGTGGFSRIHTLSAPGRKVLKSGGEDWFILLSPHSLGELLNIRLWHDNSGKRPSWYCKRVVVRELCGDDVKGVWVFKVDRWLTVSGLPLSDSFSGTLPCCKVRIASPKELSQWREHFEETATHSFSEKHLWFSIFRRPLKSTFTSCQRLSIAVSLLLTTMMVTLMFYGAAKREPGEQIEAGGFRISVREVMVAIQSVIITSLINIPIAWLFQSSDPSDFSIRELFTRKKVQKVEHEYQLEQVMLNAKHGAEQIGEDDGLQENGTNPSESERKGTKSLPNWCRLIGWIICFSYILISSYIVCLYGLSYGRIKSLLWLSSVLLAVFKRALLIQPLNILILSILQSYAKTIAGLDGEHLKKVHMAKESDMKIQEVNKKILEPNLLQRVQEEKIKLRHLTGKSVQPLSREEVNALGLKERRWHEANSRAHDILALLLYVIALHIIAYGAGDTLAWNNAHVMERMIIYGEHNQGTPGPELANIRKYKDLTDYLNQTALPSLHAVKGFSDKPLPEDEGWTAHLPSKLIGTPRLRQIRIKPDACQIPDDFVALGGNRSCLPGYGEAKVDTQNYGFRWKMSDQSTDSTDRSQMLWVHRDSNETQSFTIHGELNTYPGNGYSINLGRHLMNSRHILRYVIDTGWIDRNTTALILEFSMYNADRNLFTSGYVLIERSPLGTFKTSYQLLTTRLFVIRFGELKWAIISLVIFVAVTLLLLWRQCRRLYLSRTFDSERDQEMEMSSPHDKTPLPKWKRLFVIFFHPTAKQTSIWDQIKDVFNSKDSVSSDDEEEEETEEDLKGLLSKRKAIPTVDPELLSSTPAYPLYPLSAPSFIEWFLIFMSVIILIVYVERSNAMHEPLQRLDRGASSNERHKFVSLLLGVRWDYVYRYALAFDLCIATTALWRALPSFRLLPERALIRSSRGPLPTMTICFGVVLLAFAFGSHISSIFGSSTRDFSSLRQSLSTLCAWALGALTTEEVIRVGVCGKLLHCTFVLGCSIYIINLFLTIVMEDFGKAQSEIKKKKRSKANEMKEYGVVEFLSEYWTRNRPFWKKLKKKCKKTCCCCFFMNPKGKAILETNEMDGFSANGMKRVNETLPTKIQESSFFRVEEPTNENGNESSNDNAEEHSSTQNQLRLRVGGPATKTQEEMDETALGHAFENIEQVGDFHLRTNRLLIALLRRPKAQGVCAQLEWTNIQKITNLLPSCNTKSSEENLIDRMKAMTAVAITLSMQRNYPDDLEFSQRV